MEQPAAQLALGAGVDLPSCAVVHRDYSLFLVKRAWLCVWLGILFCPWVISFLFPGLVRASWKCGGCSWPLRRGERGGVWGGGEQKGLFVVHEWVLVLRHQPLIFLCALLTARGTGSTGLAAEGGTG